MKKIAFRLLVLSLTIALFYFLYQRGQQPSLARPFAPYRLDQLAEQPMPKANFLAGVHFYAEAFCSDQKFLALLASDEDSCRERIDRRRQVCLEEMAVSVPAELADREVVNDYSSRYIRCVTEIPAP